MKLNNSVFSKIIKLLITSYFLAFSVYMKAQKDTVYAQDTIILLLESNFEIEDKTSLLHQDIGQELLYKTPAFIKDYGAGSLSTISYQGTSANQTSLYWNDINLNPSNSGTTDFSLVDNYHFTRYKLATNENNRQGSGIGADIDLIDQTTLDSGFTYQSKLVLKQYNRYSLGAKVNFIDNVNTIKLSLFTNGGENDFKFYNPITESYERRQNNDSKSLSGLVTYDRLLKNKILYFKSWSKYADRSIPSPLLVQDQMETQVDLYSRNVLGIKGVWGNSTDYDFFSSLIYDGYQYENPTSGILGIGKIKRNFSQFKMNQQLVSWWEHKLLLFTDIQHVLLATNRYKRNLVGFSWNNIWTISKKTHVTNTVRKEYYSLEKNLPMVYDFKIDYERKYFIAYSKFQSNARKPTLNDLYWEPGGNPNLDSETSKIVFFGFKSSKWIDFELEVFKGNIDQMIVWLPNNNNGLWSPQNFASVERQGINLSVSKAFKINPKTTAVLSTLYSYTESVDKDSKLQLIYIPLQQLKWSISLETTKKWSVTYNGLYSDLWYVTRDHSSFLPSFSVSDIGIYKEFSVSKHKKLKVGVQAKNMFNYSYYSIPFRPMQGRVVGASIQFL